MGKDQSVEIILFHLFHIESKRAAPLFTKSKKIFSPKFICLRTEQQYFTLLTPTE